MKAWRHDRTGCGGGCAGDGVSDGPWLAAARRRLRGPCSSEHENASSDGDLHPVDDENDAAVGQALWRTIVFSDAKAEASSLALSSSMAGGCGALHGDSAQSQRESSLKGFREGRLRILVA